ncbi:MAG: BMP family lipoprotein [Dethiobacteria bacterium]
MKKWLALFLVLVLVLVVAGCAPNTEPGTEPDEDKLVYMVTDMGGVDDASFNESAWKGLERFKDEIEGWTADYIESKGDEDYNPNLRSAVESGAELIWAIGYMMADHLDAVAEDNPDKYFAIIDWGQEEMRDNVAYVLFKENEGSFLVGMIAGLTTESNVIGFIGGMEGDLIRRFEVGFRAGVHYVNPDAEVLVQYAQSWMDTEKGAQIANTMIGQKADVIYHAAGGVGMGVAQACKDKDIWFIGVDQDQSALAPEHTLTSMLKRVDNATYSISKALAEGKFPGGTLAHLGLAEDGVGYVKSEFIDEETVAKVEEVKQKIIDGEITVPDTLEGLEEFIAGQ